MEFSKKNHQNTRLPSLQSSTLPHTCPNKQKLELIQNIGIRFRTGRHSTFPASRFINDLASPQPENSFKHEDLRLTSRSINQVTFNKSNKGEYQVSLIDEKIKNPQYCKAKDNKNLVKNNEKYSNNPNRHIPSRFIPKSDQKSLKKPQLYEEIKDLQKNLGEILDLKVNKIRDELFLEKNLRICPK